MDKAKRKDGELKLESAKIVFNFFQNRALEFLK